MTGGLPKTRIATVLGEQRARLGSYDRLAERIARASGGEGIDRRKLKKLVEGEEDVTLKLSELGRIDAYLGQFGEGLSEKPLFEAPGLLQALGESGNVALLYGSYPRTDPVRTELIHWDIRSVAVLMRDIQRFGRGAHFDMHDIMNVEQDRTNPESIGIWPTLSGRDGPSMVSIGSPRACKASELMLAEMFGIDPFSVPDAGVKSLPFYFVWASDRVYIDSSFALPPKTFKLPDDALAARIRTGERGLAGLKVGQKFYHSSPENRSSTAYGVIAAQRRENGQVWLVLSGLAGPATFACARVLHSLLAALPREHEAGTPSSVIWFVVEAMITLDESQEAPGDVRRLTGQRIHSGPYYWPEPIP